MKLNSGLSIPRRCTLAAAAFLLLQISIYADPRLVPDPRLPTPDQYPAGFDAKTFARIALIASGTDDAELEPLEAKLDALAETLKSGIAPGADEQAKAEAILSLMYDRILDGYSTYQTRVDVALKTGDYNCVSSALLFCYFAKTVDLAVGGVETPDHAFCTVSIQGRSVDVETTNPYGYDPGRKRAVSGANPAQKKYIVIEQKKYASRKPVGERRFLALAYNNRISRMEQRGEYEAAIGLALDSWKLQGELEGDKDLAERFMNYAGSLALSGRETDAIDFFLTVGKTWGIDRRYGAVIENAAGTKLNALMKKGNYAGGFEFLDDYEAAIGPDALTTLEQTLAYNYLINGVDTLSFTDALARIDDNKEMLKKSDYENVLSYLYAKEADRIAKSGAWLDAVAVLEDGIDKIPGQSELSRQRTTYRQNYAVDTHNKAATAWNAGDHEGAKQIIRQGLAAMPDSPILANDLNHFQD